MKHEHGINNYVLLLDYNNFPFLKKSEIVYVISISWLIKQTSRFFWSAVLPSQTIILVANSTLK